MIAVKPTQLRLTRDFLFRQAVQALSIRVRLSLPPGCWGGSWFVFEVLSCPLLLAIASKWYSDITTSEYHHSRLVWCAWRLALLRKIDRGLGESQ